ncbi:MAG: hypothetical protein PUD20_08825 [bacterium]|nr:hypothetical protein [bacterium]
MKKRMAVLLSLIFAMSTLTVGCGSKNAPVKTGVGMSVSVSGSTEAAEEDGTAAADATIAAVTVDANGKIVACAIDVAQTKVNFDAEGKLTTDVATQFQSKQELGEAYGMKQFSGIGKEWNEQADAFAVFCIGKTADEVAGIAADDADLTASCTIHVNEFQAAVAKAVANATELGAQSTDKLGLGVATNIAKSKDASDAEDGLAQAYTTVSVVTVDEKGKITSSTLDAVQANVNFDATGKITSDINAEVATKNELGEGYGMKEFSGIGKEWNEQAAAYAAYCVGKTADEVKAIELNEGAPADADLVASCTIHVTDFNTVITKAVANAK